MLLSESVFVHTLATVLRPKGDCPRLSDHSCPAEAIWTHQTDEADEIVHGLDPDEREAIISVCPCEECPEFRQDSRYKDTVMQTSEGPVALPR